MREKPISILLIEDDPGLGHGLRIYLELEGFTVTWRKDLVSGSAALEGGKPNLVLLDLGLPDGSGLDFLRRLRRSGNRIPVIVLTARIHEEAAVQSLKAGANDYVRKPFGQKELTARIMAALERGIPLGEVLTHGELTIFVNERRIRFRERELSLNRREFDILCHLMTRSGEVVSRNHLLADPVYGEKPFDRTIDSHISRLRKSFKQAGVDQVAITSIYGVGYRLDKL